MASPEDPQAPTCVHSLVRITALLGLLSATGAANAQPASTAPPTSPGRWAETCGDGLTAAGASAGRTHRLFRGVVADVLSPIDLPSRGREGGRTKPLPPVRRVGWSAHWSAQDLRRPEYFYLDVVDVRDDRGGWDKLAGRGTWACTGASPDGTGPGFTCVQRRGDRLAVVRALAWRRSARVEAYRATLLPAAEACLR